MELNWKEMPTKRSKTAFGRDWEYRRWEADFAKIAGAVEIQGPIPSNDAYRVMFYGRWKDAVVRDCQSLEEAKIAGSAMVAKWLNDSGLAVAS